MTPSELSFIRLNYGGVISIVFCFCIRPKMATFVSKWFPNTNECCFERQIDCADNRYENASFLVGTKFIFFWVTLCIEFINSFLLRFFFTAFSFIIAVWSLWFTCEHIASHLSPMVWRNQPPIVDSLLAIGDHGCSLTIRQPFPLLFHSLFIISCSESVAGFWSFVLALHSLSVISYQLIVVHQQARPKRLAQHPREWCKLRLPMPTLEGEIKHMNLLLD